MRERRRATVDSDAPLTAKQLKFVRLYFALDSASEAYRRAYDCKSMSPKTINECASRLLGNRKIAARLKVARDRALKATDVTAERIALELARIAFADPRAFLDERGERVPLDELPTDAAAAVEGVTIVESVANGQVVQRTFHYRTSSKVRALEALARWREMLIDRTELTLSPPRTWTNDEILKDIQVTAAKLGIQVKLPATSRAGSATDE